MLLQRMRHVAGAMALALATAGCAESETVDQGQPLAELRQRIEAGEIPNIHAVLVEHRGAAVAEWYFAGPDERRGEALGVVEFGPETLHDIRSATKSVVAILFGVALSEQAIASIDAPALDYFPEYPDLQTEERRRVTLRHLLTMTSGWRWDEDTYPYTDPRNSETAMDLAEDRLRYVLSQPFDAAPGAQFTYSGGDVALIAEVIERAVGEPLEDYARRKLFDPLGVTDVEWLKDDKGIPIAASGLRMRPRDMLKIGRMMLAGGRYDGRRILAEDWVVASVEAQTVVRPPAPCDGLYYGYFWWLGPACPEAGDPAWYSAIGNGGQRIFVAPELDLVIVVTSGLYNDPRQRLTREIMESVVAWAARKD